MSAHLSSSFLYQYGEGNLGTLTSFFTVVAVDGDGEVGGLN